MGVLILLGVMVAFFAFTLGVHLGKRITTGVHGEEIMADGLQVETSPDGIPKRAELTEQEKGVENAVDEAINKTLHEEVARTGVELDVSRQVELPIDTIAKEAGKTTVDHKIANSFPPLQRPSPLGRFTIQIGSFSTLDEASQKVKSLDSLKLSPFIRAADLGQKGTWYRIYVGGYGSINDAEKAGRRFRTKKVIRSFIVAKMP